MVVLKVYVTHSVGLASSSTMLVPSLSWARTITTKNGSAVQLLTFVSLYITKHKGEQSKN